MIEKRGSLVEEEAHEAEPISAAAFPHDVMFSPSSFTWFSIWGTAYGAWAIGDVIKNVVLYRGM